MSRAASRIPELVRTGDPGTSWVSAAGTLSEAPRTSPADATSRTLPRTTGDRRSHATWSPDRLAAAVSVSRAPRTATPFNDLLSDELDFFNTIGAHHDVDHGELLVRRGEQARDVHLVDRGAVAEISGVGDRRPIAAFALPNEVCGAIPVVLHEAAGWDCVAITPTSLVTVQADRFHAAVRDWWADRWATRALWWLAEFGARATAVDDIGLAGEVAALLLRHRDGPIESSALADVLDVTEGMIERVLGDFRRAGAIRLTGGRVSVVRVERLHGAVTAGRRLDTRLARRRD